MAKLEGVKTLDMVNGEITKIAYDGAAYERVEGKAEAGDLALAIKSAEDTTLGNFYPVTDISYGEIMYMDDADDEQVNPLEYFRIFRKVNASTNPSVEERVAKVEGEIESLKSDVAALKGEAEFIRIAKSEARAGDYVKFGYPPSFLTAKEYYEIKEFEDGDPVIIDDDGDEYDTYSDDFEVYRKAGAASVEAEPKPERLKVGDYAKVVNATDYHRFRDGDIVEIVEDPFTGPINECARKITGGVTQYVPKRQLVRATDEEVAEAKRAAKWAEIGREVGEYKKGDIIAYDDLEWFGNSGIGEVVGFDVGTPRVRSVNRRGDKVSMYLDPRKLRLITPVEARFDR